MVTNCHYKLLEKKCISYFSMFVKIEKVSSTIVNSLTELDKARFGFYFYALEEITGVSDFSDIVNMITDTDFNKKFYKKPFEDFGIDAVYISNDDHKINLFNFKYRNEFKIDSLQKENELVISNKYVDMINNQQDNNAKGIVKEKIKKIFTKFYGDKEPWAIDLFYVTNESKSINDSIIVNNFGKTIHLNTYCYSLDEISSWLMTTHNDIDAKLIVEKTAMMSYKENMLSSNTSYILRLSLGDLLRITCDNKGLRMNANCLTKHELADLRIDFDVLAENVRGLVMRSKFNKNIERTLEMTASKFFMYNNGMTVVVKNIDAEEYPNGKNYDIKIEGLQVINGGQTLRTIHNYNLENKLSAYDNIMNAEILVRVFKVSDSNEYNKIAEFTNSQNSISQMDLKSISSEQIALEKYLAENRILYTRKRGDIGMKNINDFDSEISLERFGQILYAIKGDPDKATNKKKNIFDADYDRLFLENNDLLSPNTVNYIIQYNKLRIEYRSLIRKSASLQISLYLVYLKFHVNLSNDKIIKKIDSFITDTFKDMTGSDINRQLITTKFKETIDNLFGIKS